MTDSPQFVEHRVGNRYSLERFDGGSLTKTAGMSAASPCACALAPSTSWERTSSVATSSRSMDGDLWARCARPGPVQALAMIFSCSQRGLPSRLRRPCRARFRHRRSAPSMGPEPAMSSSARRRSRASFLTNGAARTRLRAPSAACQQASAALGGEPTIPNHSGSPQAPSEQRFRWSAAAASQSPTTVISPPGRAISLPA